MRRILTGVLVAAMVLAGCGDDVWRRAARASDAIAQGIHSAWAMTRDLHAAGVIDTQEAIGAAEALRDLNTALGEFNARARQLHSIDPKNRSLLVAYVGELADAVNRLNQSGALRVKNPEARGRLSASLASIQASAQILADVVGRQK